MGLLQKLHGKNTLAYTATVTVTDKKVLWHWHQVRVINEAAASETASHRHPDPLHWMAW
jgi:hypothetical protein